MKKFLYFLSTWLPVILWCYGIYFLSDIPSLDTGWGIWDFIFRKIAHMTEFAVLCGLILRAFIRTIHGLRRTPLMVLSGTFSLLYAMSDEFHQSFVPGRTMSARDVLIDSIGITVALYLFAKIWRNYE